jgi:S-formylglutathione hydrolase FrmB
MRTRSIALLVLPLFAAAAGSQLPLPIPTGTLISATMHSPALEHNLLGDPADQRVDIYLPPGYDARSNRRYPVIYFLHGLLGQPDDFTKPTFQGMTVEGALDTLIAAGKIRAVIAVVPNGRNRYGGSYYANSSVDGNWEDYIVHDLVTYIDSHYRTQPNAKSRGLAGHSMGGFGALRIAMKHPEVFGAVYAMSPCCVGIPAELPPSNPVWPMVRSIDSVAEIWSLVNQGKIEPLEVVSFTAALLPNPSAPPLYVTLPVVGQPGEEHYDSTVYARWIRETPLNMAARYAANLRRLRGIAFDVGLSDQFAHIPPTTQALSDTLDALRIKHTYERFDGDHRSRLGSRMSSRVLPFFARTLVF